MIYKMFEMCTKSSSFLDFCIIDFANLSLLGSVLKFSCAFFIGKYTYPFHRISQ